MSRPIEVIEAELREAREVLAVAMARAVAVAATLDAANVFWNAAENRVKALRAEALRAAKRTGAKPKEKQR